MRGKTLDTPSIKGTAFQGVVEDLQRLTDGGRLSRERVEAALEAADVALLDEKVNPAGWYPIASYARMVALLAELEARGSQEAYWVERGRRAAERLAASGIYQQLDASSDKLGQRIGHFVITLARVIYTMGDWRFVDGERSGQFLIEVGDAQDIPECSRYTTQGFMEVVASRTAGVPTAIHSERPSPDRILYHAEPG